MPSSALPAPEIEPEASPHALSAAQIEQFVSEGHLILRRCFEREDAAPLVEEAWRLMGYEEDDPATWAQPLRFLFPSEQVPLRDLAPPLWAAICQIAGGESRLSNANAGIGQWVINLGRGKDEEWTPPGPQVKGWHVDGNFFRHFLDSPEQGLLVVPLFSDVATRGGGTVFAPDSIPVVSKFLHARPEGVLMRDFGFQKLVEQCSDFREFTGEVGDVAIFHPLMMHSFSQNHSGRARFITNVCLSLREPLRFDRGDADETSPVERAILRGLGEEKLDWKISGQRERVQPDG
jgi:hypothetical protein